MPTVLENSFLSEENSFSEKKSSSWIKENMIESPTKRALAEIQLRVQRATERLEIPDWYLNKTSKAPKILKYSTSSDYREPSWRRGVKPEQISTDSPKNSSDPTGIYKTSKEQKSSMNESLPSRSYGTPRMLEKSTNGNNSSSPVYETPSRLYGTNRMLEKSTNGNNSSSPVYETPSKLYGTNRMLEKSTNGNNSSSPIYKTPSRLYSTPRMLKKSTNENNSSSPVYETPSRLYGTPRMLEKSTNGNNSSSSVYKTSSKLYSTPRMLEKSTNGNNLSSPLYETPSRLYSTPRMLEKSTNGNNSSSPVYKTPRLYSNPGMLEKSTNGNNSSSPVYKTPRLYSNPGMLEKSTNENNSSSNVCKVPEIDKSGMKNPEPIEIVESGATGPKMNETFIKFPRPSSFILNKSGTFPKISPSRKMKNINIVFPPPKAPPKAPPKPDLPKSSSPSWSLETNCDTVKNSDLNFKVNKSNFSFEVNKSNLSTEVNKSNLSTKVNESNSFGSILSDDEKFNTPRRNKMNTSSSFNSSFVHVISPKPFSKKADTPIASPAFDFNIPENSTLKETEPKLFTSALDKRTPSPKTSASHENTEHVENFSKNTVTTPKSLLSRKFWKLIKEKKHSTYWLGEVKPFGPNCPKTCQECGAKTPRIFAAVTSNPKSVNQIIKEKLIARKYEKIQGASANQTIPTAPVTNIENVEEKKIQNGDNLAQEIIQELKEKCKLKNSDDLLGTNYFVKRLANDLGGEDQLDDSSEEEVDQECSDSDPETNSLGSLSSISTSFKMSEPGSHCGIVTSTLKSSVVKSRTKKNKQLNKTYSAPFEDKEVFWIPVKTPDLPRTSTLMSSKPKRSESKTDSPCISPILRLSNINRADERNYQKFYGILDSKPKVATKKFMDTDKGGVLDSGYSDRSSNNANKSVTSSINDSISNKPLDRERLLKAANWITIEPHRKIVF